MEAVAQKPSRRRNARAPSTSAPSASLFSTALAKAGTTASDKSGKAPKGEKSEPVKGHSYTDTTGAPLG